MVTRRNGREWALQMLCQFDLNPAENLDEAIAAFWNQQIDLQKDEIEDGSLDPKKATIAASDEKSTRQLPQIKEFAEARVRGVLAKRDELDAALEPYLENWKLYRLGTIERNVLRMGAWEIMHCPSVPAPVVVNECIDIAKYFSSNMSGRFVNGVLDRLAKAQQGGEVSVFNP